MGNARLTFCVNQSRSGTTAQKPDIPNAIFTFIHQ